MNHTPNDQIPSSDLLTNSAVAVTTVVLLTLIYCLSRALETGWEHIAVTVFSLSRDQANQLILLGLDTVYCLLLTKAVSKIEKSGARWSDGNDSDVKDARKYFLYIVFISGLLLVCSEASLLSITGFAILVLVLGLRAGFFFYKFQKDHRVGSFIFTLTTLMFLLCITWAFFSR